MISLTTGGWMVYESRGELDLLLMLDVDYRTVELTTQPEEFRFKVAGRWRRYTPDVFSRDVFGGAAFWDVKRGRRLDADPGLGGRRDAIEAQCAERVAEFHLSPREAFRPGHRLANAYRIYASACVRDVTAERRVSVILARHRPSVTLAALRADGLDPTLHSCLLGMVGRRQVAIALDRSVDDDTLEVHW